MDSEEPQVGFIAGKAADNSQMGQLNDDVSLPTAKSEHKESSEDGEELAGSSRNPRKLGSWVFESVGGFYVPTEDISKLTMRQQESLLIKNLIYAFSGVPSSHIHPNVAIADIGELSTNQIEQVRFSIDERFSGAFRTLASELLPLIGYFINVQSFIENNNISTDCCRSLGLALQKTMTQYFEVQAALETQLQNRKLNLQQLVRQLRPWLHPMLALATLSSRVRSVQLSSVRMNSAHLLSMMDEHQEHFKCAQLKQLLTDVSHYYMKMVQLWTQKGVLYDVRREFFVEDTSARDMSSTLLSPKQCCHAYWLQRYRLHLHRLPSFLEPLLEPIFLAGKYLNVLRQCNVELKLMQAPLSYVPGEQEHVDLIRSSYELPARKLVHLLVQEQQLLQHLDNLQAYFLLQEPSLTQALLCSCAELLKCTVDCVKPEQLQKLLLQALQQSADPHRHLLRSQLMSCAVTSQLTRRLKRQMAQHPEKQPVSSEMDSTSETDAYSEPAPQLTLYAYEAFTLSYEPKWPISLVIHREPLEQLQLLHRVLFYLHYVQHQLQPTCLAAPSDNCAAWTLLQRMSECIRQLEQHMSRDIIQLRWQALLQLASKAQLVDELLTQFEDTLDQCLLLCLLSEPVTYVRSLYTLGQLCLNYNSLLLESFASPDFDCNVAEFQQEFNELLAAILQMIRELARPNGAGGEQERESCQQLLQRLEPISKDLDDNSL